ncbi:MAG: hypothetical protein IPK03_06780 [Bacteroidetes bacterium]|nr:hypothetical protein [Bacteroidota bacterium]
MGNGTAVAVRANATQMSLPSATDTVKMIGITSAGTYYMLNRSGTLYALGANGARQIGDFTTTQRLVWVNCKKPSGGNFTDVQWISPGEHERSYPNINVFTFVGRLYCWGDDNGNMMGRGGVTAADPLTPPSSDSTDIITFVETGGHTTAITKIDSARYCYVGHKITGSMGDGTNASAFVNNYDCINTPTVSICGSQKPKAGPDQVKCGGSAATISGTNTPDGNWAPQAGNPVGATLSSTVLGVATVTFTNTAVGTFFFIYTDGLSDTMSITVTAKSNAGADQIGVCGGNLITLTGTSPATGTWTAQSGNPVGATLGSSSGGIANASFTNTSAGTYRFIYTASACPDTMNVTVTSKPSAGADQINQCGGKVQP